MEQRPAGGSGAVLLLVWLTACFHDAPGHARAGPSVIDDDAVEMHDDRLLCPFWVLPHVPTGQRPEVGRPPGVHLWVQSQHHWGEPGSWVWQLGRCAVGVVSESGSVA
jgi:hypothetical protein